MNRRCFSLIFVITIHTKLYHRYLLFLTLTQALLIVFLRSMLRLCVVNHVPSDHPNFVKNKSLQHTTKAFLGRHGCNPLLGTPYTLSLLGLR